jgi:TetR/AcrR family transcriptional repressor of mexJK operon
MKKPAPSIPEIALRGRPKDSTKRDGIVRAASALFFKDGYELTSMEAIAKKADVSKLTIYSHFANKDELFKEVVRERCDRRALSFMEMADEPVEKALTKIGMDLATLLFSPDSIHLQRIIQAEAARHPKVVRLFYDAGPKRVRAAFGELLSTWHKRGSLDVPDITRATEQFFSLLKGEPLMKTLMLLTGPPDAAEIKKHVRATVALFLAGYRPKQSKVSK